MTTGRAGLPGQIIQLLSALHLKANALFFNPLKLNRPPSFKLSENSVKLMSEIKHAHSTGKLRLLKAADGRVLTLLLSFVRKRMR